MTTFTTLTSSDLDPDSPITTNLANAWYGNPLAIAEDDATAPAFKGRIKAAQIATSSPIASYAVASGEAVLAFAVVEVDVTGWGGGGSVTVTVNIEHNSVVIGTVDFKFDQAETGHKKNATVFGYSTTAATANLEVTSSYDSTGLTLTTTVRQLGAVRFVAP